MPPPADPSIRGGTVLVVRSGENEVPVPGAQVSLSGQSQTGAFTSAYTTDASGQIVLDRTVMLSPAALVDINAAGFLSRATLLRQGETTFSLWPVSTSTGLDETFSSTIAYSTATCPAINAGQSLLRRATSAVSTIQVSFGPSLQDAQAEAAHRTAISRLNEAVGGTPRYEFTTAPGSGVSFVAEIDPNAATCTAGTEPLRAATFLNATAGSIMGGRLVFCTVNAARAVNLVLHELGHTLGLYHSPSTNDVMYCSTGRPGTFSARERLVMTLVRQRRAGNRWPDNDRDATAAFITTGGTEVIMCGDGTSGD
jgi:hypothetical protein